MKKRRVRTKQALLLCLCLMSVVFGTGCQQIVALISMLIGGVAAPNETMGHSRRHGVSTLLAVLGLLGFLTLMGLVQHSAPPLPRRRRSGRWRGRHARGPERS